MSAFCRLWSTAVVGIEFGGPASDRPVSNKPAGPNLREAVKTCRQHYYNFVTELWFLAPTLIEGDQMRQLPTSVMEEGVARAWDFVSQGTAAKIQVEIKADMKLRFGRSPDLFDTLVVALEMARRLGLEVGVAPKRLADLEDMLKEFKEERRKAILEHSLTY